MTSLPPPFFFFFFLVGCLFLKNNYILDKVAKFAIVSLLAPNIEHCNEINHKARNLVPQNI